VSELLQNALPKNKPVFPADGGSRFLRIVFRFTPDYTASHPKDSVIHEEAGF
jgi:hypothetical protein